ncbi:MAG: hypothetical protein ABIT96_05030 [Ferruginibacter sp.]
MELRTLYINSMVCLLKASAKLCWVAAGVIFLSQCTACDYALSNYTSSFAGSSNKYNNIPVPGRAENINATREDSRVGTSPFFHYNSFIPSVCIVTGARVNKATTLDTFILPGSECVLQVNHFPEAHYSKKATPDRQSLLLIYPHHSFW